MLDAFNAVQSQIQAGIALLVSLGKSDFDIRHLINANWHYELPFGRDGAWAEMRPVG